MITHPRFILGGKNFVMCLIAMSSTVTLLALGAPVLDEDHRELLTIDSHIDIPANIASPAADFRVDGPMQVDLPKMIGGGLDAGFFIVFVPQGKLDSPSYTKAREKALGKFEAIDRLIATSNGDMALARHPLQVEENWKRGVISVMVGLENAYSFGPEFEYLHDFHARGLSYASLTHVGHNQFATSSYPASSAEGPRVGLTPLGRDLVHELNRLGVMVDVSHSSKATTLQAANHSKTPVIASHSGVYSLNAHPRNLSDEEIIAIASRGGVVQLVAYDTYLRPVSKENAGAIGELISSYGMTNSQNYADASQETLFSLREDISELGEQWPRATVSTLVDHIDYVVNLVGIDHAGIASDFGGGGGVEGWDSANETSEVSFELYRRGYTSREIQKIWGGNLLRVWLEVCEHAKSCN